MEKLGRKCKELMIKELKEDFEKSSNLFITDFDRVDAKSANILRSSLKNVSAEYRVVKNTLTKRVIAELGLNNLLPLIDKSVGITFTAGDVVETSKVLAEFAKNNKALKIKGGLVDGQLVSAAEIKEIALLPSREVLISRVLSGISAPINGFMNVLNGTIRGLAYVLKAISEKNNSKK